MFNTEFLNFGLKLLSVSRIIFSIFVPQDFSEIPSAFARLPEDYSIDVMSTSTIAHTSPVPEDLQNIASCEFYNQWRKCVVFLEMHLNKNSKEHRQLQAIVQQRQSHGMNQFMALPIQAVLSEFAELIQALLHNGLRINFICSLTEGSMLHNAAKLGIDDIVTFLITQGADIDVQNRPGDTPLHEAANHFHLTTVKLLLDAGADVNVTDWRRDTPLSVAIRHLSTDPDVYNTEYMIKIINRNTDIIKLLLEYKSDINIADHFGQTPLHLAAERGSLTIVKLLLDGGANINATDDLHKTPLHHAARWGHLSVIEYLITRGIDITIKDSVGNTAVDVSKF